MASWGEQFSSGDQGSGKETFFSGDMKTCPQCLGTDIKMLRECAGCRRNGDGYGTEVYTCASCSWSTSFQYDDAAESYYYEMNARPRSPPFIPPPIELNEQLIEKYLRVLKVIPENQVPSCMRQEGLTENAIKEFFEVHVRPKKFPA